MGINVPPKYSPSSAQAIYSCPEKKTLKTLGIGNLSDSRLSISSARPTQSHWNKFQLLQWSIKFQWDGIMYRLPTVIVFFNYIFANTVYVLSDVSWFETLSENIFVKIDIIFFLEKNIFKYSRKNSNYTFC